MTTGSEILEKKNLLPAFARARTLKFRRTLLRDWLLYPIGFRFLVKLEQRATQHVPASGAVIIIMNHIAFIDPAVVGVSLKKRFVTPMAKKEVMRLPLVKWIAKAWGVIPVDRDSVDRNALMQTLALLEDGHAVLIAPEGTRHTAMQEIKEGLAFLATKSNAIIVPATVEGTDKFIGNLKRFRRTPVQVTYGPAFRFKTAGRKRVGRDELEQMTREAAYQIALLLDEPRRGVYADLSQATTTTLDFLNPQNTASLCVEISTILTPRTITSKALLPAPFDWISIPAGNVTLENGHGTFDVPAFTMAKYPITVAQYELFMRDDGYQNADWWTTAGWQAREQGWDVVDGKWQPTGKPWIEPRYWNDNEWQSLWKADHPIVGISWYEAYAFTGWLSVKTGEDIHLPTEQQWQWAAQGDDGRVYPWGKYWDASRCNNDVMGRDWQKRQAEGNMTTSVTLYAGKNKGDSPFGVVDMTGNVWEWTLSAYGSAQEDIDSTNIRMLRGGSWLKHVTNNFRCVGRYYRGNPYYRDRDFGFRVARSSS